MFMSPWNDPITLKRAWCLFEIYCTILTKSKFDIILSDKGKKKFVEDLTTKGVSTSFNEMVSTIDIKKSDCYLKTDRDNIFILVTVIGENVINEMILKLMRNWTMETIREIATSTDNFLEHTEIDLMKRMKMSDLYGSIIRIQGNFQEVRIVYEKVLSSIDKNELFKISPDYLEEVYYLKCPNEINEEMFNLLTYDEKEAMIIEVLKLDKGILNNLAPDERREILNTASMYITEKSETNFFSTHNSSESLFSSFSVNFRRGIEDGRLFPKIYLYISILIQLLHVYEALQEINVGITLCKDVLELLKSKNTKLGFNILYPTILHSLGILYATNKEYSLAVEIFEKLSLKNEVLKVRIEKWMYSEVRHKYNNRLMVLYRQLGDFEKALPLYEESLAYCKSKYNDRHPDYLTALNNMGVIYMSLERFTEAVDIFKSSFDLFIEVLGEKNPRTILTMYSLADAYSYTTDLENVKESYKYAKKSHDLFIEVFGMFHPHVAMASDLIEFLEKKILCNNIII